MDKERLREAIERSTWSGENIVADSRLIFEAAEKYLTILDGNSVVVPREPTEETLDAMRLGYNHDSMEADWTPSNCMTGCYRAMIAAHEGDVDKG